MTANVVFTVRFGTVMTAGTSSRRLDMHHRRAWPGVRGSGLSRCTRLQCQPAGTHEASRRLSTTQLPTLSVA
jgi:hypothetical protein